eukprot:COSAG02_NODE_1062_length_14852_cov_93.088660_4_plen_226_part_00
MGRGGVKLKVQNRAYASQSNALFVSQGSRAHCFNERPRPHSNGLKAAVPPHSVASSRNKAVCAFRLVPRPRGWDCDGPLPSTKRIIAASRHFARRVASPESPMPRRLTSASAPRPRCVRLRPPRRAVRAASAPMLNAGLTVHYPVQNYDPTLVCPEHYEHYAQSQAPGPTGMPGRRSVTPGIRRLMPGVTICVVCRSPFCQKHSSFRAIAAHILWLWLISHRNHS